MRVFQQPAKENRKAMELMTSGRLFSQEIAILRQELDSLVRIIYLLSIKGRKHREDLINSTLNGRKWKDRKGKIITDRQMVDRAQKLQHWAQAVYKFGCAFIHLSNYHDYNSVDPVKNLNGDEKKALINYLNYYQGACLNSDFTLQDLRSYTMQVFEKISSNLECYLKDLEKNMELK